ncbi:cadherin EGF LAG seven-pass G-type receptor 3, partial [Lates japonicus]
MGDGYLADFMVPGGGIAQRNLPIQFTPGSITERHGQRFLPSKSAIPKLASEYPGPVLDTPTQTQTGDNAESGKLSAQQQDLWESALQRDGPAQGALTASPPTVQPQSARATHVRNLNP